MKAFLDCPQSNRHLIFIKDYASENLNVTEAGGIRPSISGWDVRWMRIMA